MVPEMGLRRRLFLLLLAIVQVSMCSGVMFGWPSLEKIMTDYGIFADLCGANEASPCDSQKLRFSLVYTVGVFMNTVAPVGIGYFVDRYGPKLTNIGGSILFSIGAMLFSVSLLYRVDIILVAFAILSGSGPAISLSVFHLSNLFPTRELTIMSTFSGVFTISSLVFPMFGVLYDYGVHLGHAFGGYVVVLLPIFLTGYFLFPFRRYEQAQAGGADEALLLEELEVVVNAKTRAEIKNASFKEQVMQKDFWFVIGFLAVQSLRVSMYVGTLNDRFPGDNIYTKAFPYIWPSGIVFIPVIGWMLDRVGHPFTYAVLLADSIAYCILDLIRVDQLQFVTFILISYANVANWGTLFSFISWRFGFANYGKLLGVCSVTVAVFGLLQYLLVFVTVHKLVDKYFVVNVVMACLNVPLLYVPYYLRKI